MVDGGLRGAEPAAVGKAVGRDVDDAHHVRLAHRQAAQVRSRHHQRIEEVGDGDGVAAPLRLVQFADAGGAQGYAAARHPLDDLEAGEVEMLVAGQRQAAAHLIDAVAVGHAGETDRPEVEGTGHRSILVANSCRSGVQAIPFLGGVAQRWRNGGHACSTCSTSGYAPCMCGS